MIYKLIDLVMWELVRIRDLDGIYARSPIRRDMQDAINALEKIKKYFYSKL